jgi:hypothetical protein
MAAMSGTPMQLVTYEALRGKKPNHLLMHAWSFAAFVRKLSLQALRQNHCRCAAIDIRRRHDAARPQRPGHGRGGTVTIG